MTFTLYLPFLLLHYDDLGSVVIQPLVYLLKNLFANTPNQIVDTHHYNYDYQYRQQLPLSYYHR